jgi:hypothetical protein
MTVRDMRLHWPRADALAEGEEILPHGGAAA